MLRQFAAALAALAALLSNSAHASCGAAFCSVNTDWGPQGIWTERGARFDLRFEYLDQDQPQTGTRKLAVGEIHKHHDEVRTLNRNWLVSFDYGFDAHWGVNVALPVVDRSHEHIHNHHGAQIPETWSFAEAGDARVLGRYQFDAALDHASGATRQNGLLFGLKLPTGRHDVRNESGDLAERTLQPGSGTTDALVGAYYRQNLPQRELSWFIQGLVQSPLHSADDYRPGPRLGFDVGLRYEASQRLGLMLQANLVMRGRDRGGEAETEDSGGTALWLSPGLGYTVGRSFQVYGFVQVPIYQYVNGVQLVADIGYVVGGSLRF